MISKLRCNCTLYHIHSYLINKQYSMKIITESFFENSGFSGDNLISRWLNIFTIYCYIQKEKSKKLFKNKAF